MPAAAQRKLPGKLKPYQAAGYYAWLWVQGHRNHMAYLKRQRAPRRDYARARVLYQILIDALAPWQIGEYPGYVGLLAQVTGTHKQTVRRWIWRGGNPSVANLQKLHDLAETKIVAWEAARAALVEAIEASEAKPRRYRSKRRGG